MQFENIIGLEPAGFIGDDFAATSELFRISHYQMACVYSLMGNNEAALESLSEALSAGFSDFDQVPLGWCLRLRMPRQEKGTPQIVGDPPPPPPPALAVSIHFHLSLSIAPPPPPRRPPAPNFCELGVADCEACQHWQRALQGAASLQPPGTLTQRFGPPPPFVTYVG